MEENKQTKPNPVDSKVSTPATHSKPRKRRTKKPTVNQILGIFLVALVAIGLVAGMYLSYQNQDNRSAAAGNTELLVTPTTNNSVALGADGVAQIVIKPNGEKVQAVQFELTYDSSIIRVNSIEPGSFFTSKSNNPLVHFNTIKQSEGRLVYGISFPFKTDAGDALLFSSEEGIVANINYTMIGQGTTTLELDLDGATLATKVVSTEVNTSVLASVSSGQITTAVDNQGARLFLKRVNTAGTFVDGPIKEGETATYEVRFDTNGNQVIGVDALVTIPTNFNVTAVSGNSEILSIDAESFDETSRVVTISGNTGSNPESFITDNNVLLGTFTLGAVQADTDIPLNFVFESGSRNDSNIVVTAQTGQEPEDVLFSAEGTTLTVEEPTSDSTVEVKVRFQGKSRAEADKSSDVVIEFKNTATNEITTVTTSTNSQGSALASVPAGDYMILLDAPGYLARQFGSTDQPISIAQSTSIQTIDLTTGVLLGGDFNNDGIVNEADYAFFVNNFKTDNAIADLDASGEVNNLDFSVMRSNWGAESQTF